MSGVLGHRLGRKYSREWWRASSVKYVGQFLLGVAPGEVGVGLGEAELRQTVHDLRPGEGLGEEDDFRVLGLDAADQPLPEGEGLGVRIVDAEDASRPRRSSGPPRPSVRATAPRQSSLSKSKG